MKSLTQLRLSSIRYRRPSPILAMCNVLQMVFVPLSFFLPLCDCVLRFTGCDYPFGVFKPFLARNGTCWTCYNISIWRLIMFLLNYHEIIIEIWYVLNKPLQSACKLLNQSLWHALCNPHSDKNPKMRSIYSKIK